MKIKSIKAKEFKRFTDLTIDGIPASCKLVVLVGPNGSGKTSVFDIFNYLFNAVARGIHFDPQYYRKLGISNDPNTWEDTLKKIDITTHESIDLRQNSNEAQKRFYFRTAYRHQPDFTMNSISIPPDAHIDHRHPNHLNLPENRTSENYSALVGASVAALYSDHRTERTIGEVRMDVIQNVRNSLSAVFDDLDFTNLGNPLASGSFYFDKGSSKGFHFKNLSSGEKAAFDLILDYSLRTKVFTNTVYCIDEPELHMHSALQSKLLQELHRLTPDSSQLWITSHSIGMLKKAYELAQTRPGEVAFLDFHGRDFDRPVQISPSKPGKKLFRRMFHVAIDDLADLLAPKKIFFCEGKQVSPENAGEPGFDSKVYKKIFEDRYPDVEFISLGSTTEVTNASRILAGVFATSIPEVKIQSIIDGDDHTSEEVEAKRKKGILVLSRRSLENYLWDDEVLRILCEKIGRADAIDDLLKEKSKLLSTNAESGKPADDLKHVSGLLYTYIRKQLGLTQAGSTATAFQIMTLAPLLTHDTNTYQELNSCIFGGGQS